MVDCRRMDSDNRTRYVDVSQLCRICAVQDEHVIPIFEGHGLELEFEIKLQKYLSLKVSKNDVLPLHICLKCSNTLLAWHELVLGYEKADQHLRSLLCEKESGEERDIEIIDDDSQDSVKIIDSTSCKNTTVVTSTLSQSSTDFTNFDNLVLLSSTPTRVEKPTGPSKDGSKMETSSKTQSTKNITAEKPIPSSSTGQLTGFSVVGNTPHKILVPTQNMKRIVKPFILSRPENSPTAKPQAASSVVKISPTPPVISLPTTSVVIPSSAPTLSEQPPPPVMVQQLVGPSEGTTKNIITLLLPSMITPVMNNNLFIRIPVLCPEQGKQQTEHLLVSSGQSAVLRNTVNRETTPQDSSNSIRSEPVKLDNDSRGPSPCPSDTQNNTESMEVETALVSPLSSKPGSKSKTSQKDGGQQTNEDGQRGGQPISIIYEDHRYSKTSKTTKSIKGKKPKSSSQKDNKSVKQLLKALKRKSDRRGCFVCGKMINNRTLLYTHERSHFKSLDCLSYNCSLCSESFKSFEGMVSHRKAHKTSEAKTKKKETEKPEAAENPDGGSGFAEDNENSSEAPKVKPKSIKKKPNAISPHIKCVICELCFTSKVQLQLHKLNHTEEERANPYLCKECGKRFKNNGAIRTHLKIHTDRPGQLCAECGKVFKQRSTLVQHIRKHHDVPNPWPTHQCEFCPKKFDSKMKLVQHLNSHTGERPFACDKCDKAFHSQSNLRQHVACHLEERPFMCDVCGQAFKWPKNLKQHSMIHKSNNRDPVQCNLCDKVLNGVNSMKQHKYKFHREEFFLEHPDVERLPCHLCNRVFTSSFNLEQHIKKYHPDGQVRFACDICGKRFTTKLGRNDHLRLHTGERPYACNLCPKTFTCSSNLHAHRDAHTEERPHQCQYCDKTFKRKAHLDTHIRSHTGEKPYVCDICNRGFAQSQDMKKHRLTHTNERPFQCSFCEDTFKGKRDLVRHLAKHCASERQEEEQDIDFSQLLEPSNIVAYEVC